MCGIVGYVGSKNATGLLVDGLKRLEYRGYDSAGVSLMNGGAVETRKAKGKIAMLEEAIGKSPVEGNVGIAHTRWATHGQPNECNAHPHHDCTGTISVVHNGIIENYGPLRSMLQKTGHTFVSETDTEVLAHLIEAAFDGNLEEAVTDALALVEGTYGIAVICSRDPEKVVAARKGSPLLIGLGEGENYIASDVAAILQHTRQVVYLDDGEMAVLTKDGYRVMDLNAKTVKKRATRIDWDLDQIEKGGFDHFMLKEIMEQPQTIENTMRGRSVDDEGFSPRGSPAHRPHHPHGLRHELAQRPDRQDDDRGACAYPLRGGVRVRVPLQQSHRHGPHALHRHLAVGRNGGYAGGHARGQASWCEDARTREPGRVHDRARG
jgi:glucosamine--fructose-6-phosphate aminotransferase (isomerizing)